ncbi:MAG: FAD-dependent oxidoreductase [Solirubrobacteraceae bacterium]|nr:FAD-dependent oxidoreductase [Patulibacter sp.]
MAHSVDTLVIGGGAMGSAATWHLARRGRQPVLLERFAPGHANGASHGASRNFNVSYPDPVHLGLVREALDLWRELEAETGDAILDQVGLVNHGHHPAYDAVADALATAGFAHEFLDPADATARWPGIRFTTRALYTPEAGRLHAARAVAALQRAAVTHGATIHHGARVIAIEPRGDGARVTVHRSEPSSPAAADRPTAAVDPDATIETYDARHVVVTSGAWTSKLLGHLVELPTLVVTQEQPAHFAVTDDSIVWPGFNHSPDPADPADAYWYSGVYGMVTPGEGVKAGWHGVGPVVDPDARDFLPDPVQFEALRRYAREWLPGTDPDRATAISCTYTTTPDSMFVIDHAGPLVVGAGFSGHGFKFTPAVGRLLADLVDGTTAAPPPLFSRTRPRTADAHPAAPRPKEPGAA